MRWVKIKFMIMPFLEKVSVTFSLMGDIHKRNTLSCTMFIVLVTLSPHAFASCYFDPDSPVQQQVNITVPLQVSRVTVGPDYPVGSVVYRQEYKPAFASGKNIRITCDSKGVFNIYKSYASTPEKLSSWNGEPYAGKVYETGMPGLGAVVTYSGYSYVNGTPFPNEVQACAPAVENTSCDVPNGHFGFVITVIKTGPVTPGVLNGATLPCPKIAMGMAGNEVPVVNACFSGAVTVVSNTCQTPDVFVNLGTHDTAEFSGKGSATPWVNASIQLKNCPVFYGENRFGGAWSEDGTYSPDSHSSANQVWYTLRPVQSVIDNAQGIMNIDQSVENAAKGISIQVASGDKDSPVAVEFGTGFSLDLPSDGSQNIVIPLVSRYIQTASSVRDLKPGLANGQITFLINYY
ncbi:fimbrial protein [Scandinavium sp. NPDC088450]|uniref:fimbrial protein n=1 Tax=Scandinavium sp. NPDC088450 TaxID=3364514 RepID=UPI003850B191